MEKITITDKSYIEWIEKLSRRYRQSQIRAAVKVNSEMLRFYWELGKDIVERQAENQYGKSFYANLSKDLRKIIPGVSGLTENNIRYTKRLYELYSQVHANLQQVAEDNPTIGLLICKKKNATLAKYALESSNQPIAISEYELERFYPQKIDGMVPTIAEIESALDRRTNEKNDK